MLRWLRKRLLLGKKRSGLILCEGGAGCAGADVEGRVRNRGLVQLEEVKKRQERLEVPRSVVSCSLMTRAAGERESFCTHHR